MSQCKCMICRIGRALGWKPSAGKVERPEEWPPAPKVEDFGLPTPKEYPPMPDGNPLSLPPCETYKMKGTPSITSAMLESDPIRATMYSVRYVSELEKERNKYRDSAARANFLLEEARARIMAQAERIDALKAANYRQAARIAEMEDEMEDEREKLEKQEPSCWTTPDGKGFRMRFSPPVNDVALGWTPLYARPVPARTLTDEEIWEIYKSKYACQHFPVVFARAIEAWLKGGE